MLYLQETKWPHVKFLPGALELLQYLDKSDVPFALATSSHRHNFNLKTGHLGHGFELFRHHIVVGDDPRVPKGRGKPKPDIWFAALKSINDERVEEGKEELKPEECIVFEDGVPGVTAGRAAGSYVIWVPDKRALSVLNGTEKEIIGDQGEILGSLIDFEPTKYLEIPE